MMPLAGASCGEDRRAEWRNAAILFADVVGYTSMMLRDEEGAHALWSRFLSEAFRPALAANGAVVVRLLGDGVLATFADCAAAVDCLDAVREGLDADRAAGAPRYPALGLRFGVNFGRVLYEDGDVHGDAVNVTRRLQEAALPDTALVSQDARQAAHASQHGRLRDIGFLRLRGVGVVRAFDLAPRGREASPPAYARTTLPSIAVLPFEDRGARAEDSHLADGLIEDVIVSLASLRELFVISRSSTLAFRDRQLDPLAVPRLFGVRYVVQGSVRRHGRRIRLVATLIDCETGAALFSTQRDLAEDDLFAEQDALVQEIVANIAPHIRGAELDKALRRHPDSFSAYEAHLRALQLMRELDRGNYTAAKRWLDTAVETDPGFATAHAWRAAWAATMVAQGWLERGAAAADALAAARTAVQLEPGNAFALATLGYVHGFLLGDHEVALTYHERARAAGPGHAEVWLLSAGSHAWVGRGVEAVAFAGQALKIAPVDQILFRLFDWVAIAHYAAGDFAEAARWARRAIAEQNGHLPSLRLLAAASVGEGDLEQARSAAARVLSHRPDFRLSRYAADHATFADKALQAQWIAHLGRAGLPD